MRYFRLAHAGLVLESEKHSLFVDPGNLSSAEELQRAIAASEPVAGIVITHEHADHWTSEHIEELRKAAPEAPIFTTEATKEALHQAGINTNVLIVREGDRKQVGPFRHRRLRSMLHSSIPVVDNIGIHVNNEFAWGGDSLVRPPFRAKILGVPIGSPWSNLSQVMDFVLAARPKQAYLTHDGMLSKAGLGLYSKRVQACLDEYGGDLLTLPLKE
ncbi:MBL fold metallo-hydrolase [Micrococcoides hystricis]|uniref:MBL fold metallo-hydrolase n=1 Tax=Micrococcoides hystricis TaxID=1572761 RepID=A0ABV6PBC8_9MICC